MPYDTKGKVVYCALLAIFAYVGIAGLRYQYSHPEMTDTQRVLHLWDAMLWK